MDENTYRIAVETSPPGGTDEHHCGDPNCTCPTNAQLDDLLHQVFPE